MGFEKLDLENNQQEKAEEINKDLEEIKKNELEVERKTLLEKIYKSKTARVVALLGLFGIGAKAADIEKYQEGIYFGSPDEEKPTIAQKQETREAGPLEILADEIPHASSIERHITKGAEQTIVHLGQQHGFNNFEGLKDFAKSRNIDEKILQKEIIDNQKKLEKQMIYLQEKYKTGNIFVEGIDIETINTYKNFKESIKQSEATSQFAEHWRTLYNSYKNIIDAEDLEEIHKARMAYLVKISLEKELSDLKNSYSQKDDIKKETQQKYKQLFNLWQKNNVEPEKVFEYLESNVKEVNDNELIKSDNVYLWDSPIKLFMEDKINILPAEDKETNKKAFDLYKNAEISFTHEELKDPAVQERVKEIIEKRKEIDKQRHELRENAALNLINDLSPDQKIIPLVYGEGHDFSDNVSKLSKESLGKYNLVEIK